MVETATYSAISLRHPKTNKEIGKVTYSGAIRKQIIEADKVEIGDIYKIINKNGKTLAKMMRDPGEFIKNYSQEDFQELQNKLLKLREKSIELMKKIKEILFPIAK